MLCGRQTTSNLTGSFFLSTLLLAGSYFLLPASPGASLVGPKQWALRKTSLDAHCLALQKEIQKLEHKIDGLVMEKPNCEGPYIRLIFRSFLHAPNPKPRPGEAVTVLNEEISLLSGQARPAQWNLRVTSPWRKDRMAGTTP